MSDQNRNEGGRIDASREADYWREHHGYRAQEDAGRYDYERDYEPAYRYGWEARAEYPDRHWEDIQEELERDWEARRFDSRLTWDEAQISQDAWVHCLKESSVSDQPSPGETPPP